MKPPIDGNGWRLLEEERTLTFYFEVEGMAEDEDGNPDRAGVAMKIEIPGALPTPDRCDSSAAEIERKGEFQGHKLSRITPTVFFLKGYDE